MVDLACAPAPPLAHAAGARAYPERFYAPCVPLLDVVFGGRLSERSFFTALDTSCRAVVNGSEGLIVPFAALLGDNGEPATAPAGATT